MKKVRVIYYTQTGQLKQLLDSLLGPLAEMSGVSTEYREVKPAVAYPFPWTRKAFLNVFPETFLEVPISLQEQPGHDQGGCDLVVLAFQPWYLSPSPPISTFLKTPEAGRMINRSPVLTVIGSRNMWQRSYERVKEMVEFQGGHLVGNIAFFDRAPNLVSVVTLAYWMFTGKKDCFLGMFPKPGVSEADIAGASRFGQAIGAALTGNGLDALEDTLRKLGAAETNDSLARLENRAKRIFNLWAEGIIKRPNIRQFLLNIFYVELIVGLIILSPLTALWGRLMKLFKKLSG